MIRPTWRRFTYWSDQRLERLGRRESWIAAMALVVIIAGAQYLTAYTQGWYDQSDVADTLRSQRDEVQSLNERLAELRAQQNNPREQELERRIQQLRAEISDVNGAIDRMADAMVPPAQMIRIVQQLLETRDDLTVRRFETQPVTRTDVRNGEDGSGNPLYKHGIVLELTGTYTALAEYIRTVEAAAWQIYWEDLEFAIDTYPVGRARIRVYTLSNQEAWLDV